MIRNFIATAVFLFAVISWLADEAHGGGDPINVFLVVNSDSASSKLIANHYIHYREIPAINVLYLSGIPKGELIPLKIFKERILEPITKAIDKRGIQDHIDYIVYSSGFPSQINCNTDFNTLARAFEKRNAIIPINKKMLRPTVSINSATYFYRKILSGDPSYLTLAANHYMSLPANNILNQPFDGEDLEKFVEAVRNVKREKFDEATAALEEMAKAHPFQLAVSYWLARAYGWQGDSEKAAHWLLRSVAGGWSFREYTQKDTAFEEILEENAFADALKQVPESDFAFMPTRGFRAQYSWAPNGALVKPGTGENYVISTVLAINRNEGTSEKESLRQLFQTIDADYSKPKGTFYFTKTSNIRSKTRFNAFDNVIKELQELGHKAVIYEGVIPKGKTDIVGATIGAPRFDWSRAKNRIVPGAICENLTSFGGVMHKDHNKQTKLSEFIRAGAAGSSGTIVEPFAVQAKFPHPRIQLHYARGCTLGEAFYQSVYGPFQLLIVGDPLCSPWAEPASVEVTGQLAIGEPLNGIASFNIEPVKNSAPIARVKMYLDGVFVRDVRQQGIKLDTTTMSDGHHEMRIVTVAKGPIETRDSVVVPLLIDNNGRSVSVSTKKDSYHTSHTIEFTVESEGADELQIRHNWTILEKEKGVDKTVFKIPANQLGRGPVVVNGFAIIDGKYIQSPPLELEIKGKIRESIPELRSPWDPKPKPPAPPQLKRAR